MRVSLKTLRIMPLERRIIKQSAGTADDTGTQMSAVLKIFHPARWRRWPERQDGGA
jgi:hypothetical protein